jgi:uncharacterized membrane protein
MHEAEVRAGVAVPIAPARARWLTAESSRWVASGLIDPAARERILVSYDPAPAAGRGILALILLGVATAAIGLTLLVGYNWDRIPSHVRVGALIASVLVSFAASAAAQFRQQPFGRDMLALLGIVLYGAAIWLIATLLEIEGHYPDAFRWWAIGAVAAALLIRSRIVSIAGSVVVALWALAALSAGAMGVPDEGRSIWFGAIWLTALYSAYLVQSPAMIRILIAAAALWTPSLTPEWVGWGMLLGLPVGVGCVAFAVGARHGEHPFASDAGSDACRRAWRTTGLAAILIAFVPLLFTDANDGHNSVAISPAFAVMALVAVAATSSLVWRPRTATLLDAVVALTSIVLLAWMGLLAAGLSAGAEWPKVATATFSVLAVAFAIALIQQALQSNRLADLVFGVAFAAAFVVIRWISVIDSMLWSGLMLIGASAGFFLVARLWGSRRSLTVATVAGSR